MSSTLTRSNATANHIPLHPVPLPHAQCHAGALPHLLQDLQQLPANPRACQRPLLCLQSNNSPRVNAQHPLDQQWVPSKAAHPKLPAHQSLSLQTHHLQGPGSLIWKLTAATLPWMMRPSLRLCPVPSFHPASLHLLFLQMYYWRIMLGVLPSLMRGLASDSVT